MTDRPRSGYLIAGAFARYKRADLTIEACTCFGRSLTMAGGGPEERAPRRHARPDVRFHGWMRDGDLARLYAGARAVLFPGEEDSEMVRVKAMASGCPAVGFGRGGAIETVGRGAAPESLAHVERGRAAVVPAAVLVGTRTIAALTEAIRLPESYVLDPRALRARAEPYSAEACGRCFGSALEHGLRACTRTA